MRAPICSASASRECRPANSARSTSSISGPTARFPTPLTGAAPLPSGAAAYDLAELDERPGAELILLRRDRLTLLSLSGRAPVFRDLAVGPEPTIAAVADERGIDRMEIARDGLGGEPRLLVPGFGTTAVLAPSGETLGRLDVGARANYFVQRRPGPLVSESEVEIYFDHPRLSVGDVDGDGRGDIVSANRHELRVFAQNAQGGFPERATRRIALGLLSPDVEEAWSRRCVALVRAAVVREGRSHRVATAASAPRR